MQIAESGLIVILPAPAAELLESIRLRKLVRAQECCSSEGI